MTQGIENKVGKDCKKLNKSEVLDMKLEDFVEYSGIYKYKRMAFRLARSLIENLCYKEGRYYSMGKRKVEDLYTLTGKEVFLKMVNYGVRTVEALNEVLKKNGLPPTSIRLRDISWHPHYHDLYWSKRNRNIL